MDILYKNISYKYLKSYNTFYFFNSNYFIALILH